MISSPPHDMGIIPAHDAAHGVMDRIENIRKHGADWLETPWHGLNEMIGGLRKGELIVLAARPGGGKSAWGLNLATALAKQERPCPVLLFSLEMGRLPLMQRILSADSRVPGENIRDGNLSDKEMLAVSNSIESLNGVPLFIDDSPYVTVGEIKDRSMRMKEEHGVECVVIDYLQIVNSDNRGQPRHIQVGEISVELKKMSRVIDCPVVCFAQLNRLSENREGGRPRMADLRESGSIEQDADIVMLLHREAMHRQSIGDKQWFEEHEDEINLAELIVAKNRNGAVGTVKLWWDEHRTRFIDDSMMSRPQPASGVGNEKIVPVWWSEE